MLQINTNKSFGITPFILSSILIILVISIPAFSILRVPLILAHILFFYLTIVLFVKKVKIDIGLSIMLALVFYVLVQNLYLSEDWIVVVQSIIMPLLIIMVMQISSLRRNYFHDTEEYRKLAKVLLFILPFFMISIDAWSETRLSGLFMNPNITAHMTVMLLPFILLGIKTKKIKLLAIAIAYLIILITASRSGLMALTLGLAGFFCISHYNKANFLFIVALVSGAMFISLFAVDIAVYLLSQLPQYQSDSRLLYTGYNGRDILMNLALERFKNQPWFGLGFDGAKFDIHGDGSELGTHNGLLDLLLRIGIIGSVLFFIYSLYLIYLVSKNNIIFKPAAAMSLICIFSLATNSSTFFVFNYLFLYAVMLAYLGYRELNESTNKP